jgi:hypothetical protein
VHGYPAARTPIAQIFWQMVFPLTKLQFRPSPAANDSVFMQRKNNSFFQKAQVFMNIRKKIF